MSALADLQRLFLDNLRAGDERLLPHLAAGRRIAPALGLGIYVNAYRARLREALESDHVGLGRYLGDELWDQLCTGYLAAHPSRYRSLRQFGDHLPDYLRSAEPFATQPQIAELAAFERRLLDCFDAADAAYADWNTLQALPPDDWPALRLRFHPSLQRLRVAWNSVEIWQALKGDATPPAAHAQATEWVLWRDAERITRFRSLDTEEATALGHFLEGGDFAGFCETLLRWHVPEAIPLLAVERLQRWAQEGWIAQWVAPSTAQWPQTPGGGEVS